MIGLCMSLSGMMLMIGTMFSSSLNPLSMGLFMLIHTCLVCVYFGLIYSNFWFSLILFLVFLGGLMILFIYVASLAPNKRYSYSVVSMFVGLSLLAIGVIAGVFSDSLIAGVNCRSNHLFWEGSFTFGGTGASLYGLWSAVSTSYMVVYLLYALLVVVSFSGVGRKAALRSG